MNKKISCCYLYPITKYGYPPDANNTLKYIQEMGALGFSSIELEGIRKDHLLKVYSIQSDIKRKIDELNLNVSYYCAVLPGLSSLDEKEVNRNLALFEKGCETALVIGAKGILDNAPLPPYQFPAEIPVTRHYEEDTLQYASFPAGFDWKIFNDRLINTFRTLCDIASRYNLTYQLHPAIGVMASTTDGFLKFFDEVKRDNLRFNFDTANLFAQKEILHLSLYKLKGLVDYIHVSDNGGFHVEHLPIGTGKINWEKFFEALDKIGFDGSFGVDIGGDESNILDLDDSYKKAAEFLENNWFKHYREVN
ncbi:MAG: sugar phosphate isomerase/epimerase family protein [Melioribacteraceae bacterium]